MLKDTNGVEVFGCVEEGTKVFGYVAGVKVKPVSFLAWRLSDAVDRELENNCVLAHSIRRWTAGTYFEVKYKEQN